MPHEAFPCADDWLIIAAGNDRQFARLAELLGLEAEEGWATNAGRVADRAAVSNAIAALTRGRKCDPLLARLAELGIPGGPIITVAEALAGPQIVARGMVLELAGSPSGLRAPIRFSDAGMWRTPRRHRHGADGEGQPPGPPLLRRSGARYRP